jgi:hypothetical protein
MKIESIIKTHQTIENIGIVEDINIVNRKVTIGNIYKG